MARILREMIQAVAVLPPALKVLVGIGLVVNFIVITQWDRFFVKRPASTLVQGVSALEESRFLAVPQFPPAGKTGTGKMRKALISSAARIVIDDPQVRPDGTILYNGRILHLYGIKPFNSKDICTRASGVRWACGLHAYATLINTIAHQQIVCNPKAILPDGLGVICHMGATDIAAMLARQGLVEATEDGEQDPDLMKAQTFAKDRKLGIWDRQTGP